MTYADLAKKTSSGGNAVVFAPVVRAVAKSAAPKQTPAEKKVKEGKKPVLDKAQLDNMKNSMYIKQVTLAVTDHALREVFGKFGPITRCDVQGSKGFAFIDFAARESLLGALHCEEPHVCNGATLRVEERTPKPRDKELNGQSVGANYANKNKKSNGDNSSSGNKKKEGNGDNSSNNNKKKVVAAALSGEKSATTTSASGEKGWTETNKK